MFYVVVFLLLDVTTCVYIVDTENGKVFFDDSADLGVLLICQFTETEDIETVSWQRSTAGAKFETVITYTTGICFKLINRIGATVNCNKKNLTFSANVPIEKISDGEMWRCFGSIKPSGNTDSSTAVQILSVVQVQSVSMNTQQLIGLDEGNSIHVECQSMPLSRPRTEIIWYITGIGEITTGLDNPVYTLDVTDSTLTTTKRGLTYTDPPATFLVLSVIPSGVLFTGSYVNVTCSINGGNPLATLNLSCNGMTGSSFNTATTAITMLEFVVNASNNGNQCECLATHHVNDFRKTLSKTIEVQYAPFELPVITQSYPQTDFIYADTIVTLSCDLSGGNPLAVLYWDCDKNIAVTNNTSGNKASYSVTFRVSKQDNGWICTCLATHPVLSYRPSVQHKIKVYYVPYIHIEPKYNPFIIYTKQTNIVLTCVIDDANPVDSVTYEWNSQSGTVHTNNITLSTVNKSQDGQYSCFVTNIAGKSNISTKQIHVQYEPRLSNIFNFQHIIEGNNLIVSPIIDANPAAFSLWWSRQNNSDFRYNGSELRINKIQKTASGNYSCYVMNTISPSGMDAFNVTTWKTFYVDVQFKPFLDHSRPFSPSHVTTTENITLQLTLTVNANPTPTIEWTFRGEADWNSCNFIVLVSKSTTVGFLTTSSIIINNLHSSNFGDYAFTANNTAGIFYRRFVVRKEGQEMFASTKKNTGILVAGISTLIAGLLSLTAAVIVVVRISFKNKALHSSSKSEEYNNVQRSNPAFTDVYSTIQSDIESRSPYEQIINTYEECGKQPAADSSLDKMKCVPRKSQQHGVGLYEECGKRIDSEENNLDI